MVLRHGDFHGNHMVLRLTTPQGAHIHAVAVPQDWPSQTGPTWTYLLENDGLTLVDAGASGSFNALAAGLKEAGFRVQDIQRVIITHGHWDHDGAAAQLSREVGAEVWAHDIYAYLLPYDPWEVQRNPGSPLHYEMDRIVDAHGGRPQPSPERVRYLEERKGLQVDHRIQEGDRLGRLTFLHVPGHSPDELCVVFSGLVFTGDHVLPEISPHPTTRVQYPAYIRRRLPAQYRAEDGLYGLATYLRSLKRVADLDPQTMVLPAHRLFNRGRFNFQTVQRAEEVVQHHAARLGRILARLGSRPANLEELTRGIFVRRELIGVNLYLALSEIVAHIELLEDTGDLEVAEDGKLRGTGSENYRGFVAGLGA